MDDEYEKLLCHVGSQLCGYSQDSERIVPSEMNCLEFLTKVPPDILTELASMNVRMLASRPGIGQVGKRISVRSNFFEINLKADNMLVMQYHVEIHREGTRKLDRNELYTIFWKAVSDNRQIFPNENAIAFDGAHQAYTSSKFNISEKGVPLKLQCTASLPRNPQETNYDVILKYVGPVVIDIKRVSSNNLDERIVTPIQIIDIILRQSFNCPFSVNSENFFALKSSAYRLPINGAQAIALGGGKELLRGFFSAAHVGIGWKPLLNIDVTHTVFYKNKITLLEFMCDVINEKAAGYRKNGRSNPRFIERNRRGGFPKADKARDDYHNICSGDDAILQMECLHENSTLTVFENEIFSRAVKGVRIRAMHRGSWKKVYKITRLQTSADRLKFQYNDETGRVNCMTIADYFAQRYFQLKYPRLPCVQMGKASHCMYLPLEVCVLDSPQKYEKDLSENLTSSIIRTTSTDAPTREQQIFSLFEQAGFRKDLFLKEFGLAVNSGPVEVTARVIQPPAIMFGSTNNTVPKVVPKDGSWSFEEQRLFKPAGCSCYSLISLMHPSQETAIRVFCENLAERAIAMGMKFPKHPTVVRYAQTKEDVMRQFGEIVEEYKMENQSCNLILVILQGKNPEIYMAVKECGDIVHGVMSQCVIMKNVIRPSVSVCTNLILKLNAKLGGVNSRTMADSVTQKYIIGQPTLLVGIDVSHPTLSDERQNIPPVAAIVANIDMYPQAYHADVIIQQKRLEPVASLICSIRDHLLAFRKHTGKKPTRIIVYRDGVSDSQFSEILREEMRGIRAACVTLSPNYKPPITYIVVQKRHHARFFCKYRKDTVGKAQNIPPGTIIDTAVVSPEGFDFYLCSHFGIQGTSKPSHYHVLWDESKFTADELQAISFTLCHTYARCSRSVSIPAPIYYADLAAARARQHLKQKLGGNECNSDSSDSQSLCNYPDRFADPVKRGESRNAKGDGMSEMDEQLLQSFVSVSDSFKFRMYYI